MNATLSGNRRAADNGEAVLSLSDLRVISEEEPRLQDLKIAEALGFRRKRVIRELIVRNMAELERFGAVWRGANISVSGRGRQTEVTEYWLNEEQALLIATLSDAPRAAEVRHMLIKVFVAWRRGQLPPAPENLPHRGANSDPTGAALSAMVERLTAVEAAIGFRARTTDSDLAFSLAQMPIWKNGRRPSWWGDLEVRTLLTTAHRQTTIAIAHSLLLRRFGPDRTPSTKAIHRFWQLLDTLHAAPAGRMQ